MGKQQSVDIHQLGDFNQTVTGSVVGGSVEAVIDYRAASCNSKDSLVLPLIIAFS